MSSAMQQSSSAMSWYTSHGPAVKAAVTGSRRASVGDYRSGRLSVDRSLRGLRRRPWARGSGGYTEGFPKARLPHGVRLPTGFVVKGFHSGWVMSLMQN